MKEYKYTSKTNCAQKGVKMAYNEGVIMRSILTAWSLVI